MEGKKYENSKQNLYYSLDNNYNDFYINKKIYRRDIQMDYYNDSKELKEGQKDNNNINNNHANLKVDNNLDDENINNVFESKSSFNTIDSNKINIAKEEECKIQNQIK